MENTFAEALKSMRTKKNLSQQQLADKLFVDRSSIAHWESGRRVPDAVLISRLADFFGVNVSELLSTAETDNTPPIVILVDDEDILLAGALPILSEAMPGASITGFTRGSEALAFAKTNRISIAFLDIELGSNSGISLCQALTDICPLTNIIFLTGYPDYALKAWDTSASGFLVKPLHLDAVREQLTKLRHPVRGLTES